MKVLGQVFAVYPLAVVISLPDQLFGHVPITNISSQLSIRLEALDDDDDDERNSQRSSADEQDADENEASGKDQLPELLDMFRPGQYVCASVVAVHSAGTSAVMTGIAGRPKDEVEKASRRVELSLVPALVNESIAKADIKPGLVRASLYLAGVQVVTFGRRCPHQSKASRTTDTSSTWASTAFLDSYRTTRRRQTLATVGFK
jgi:rRNA biogenesis protein RRP5